jgi:hypothetical protein
VSLQVVDRSAELKQELQAVGDPPSENVRVAGAECQRRLGHCLHGLAHVVVAPIGPATTSGVRMAIFGVSALTAIPRPSFSPAAATVSRFSAALVASYMELPSLPLRAKGGPGGNSPLKLVRYDPCRTLSSRTHVSENTMSNIGRSSDVSSSRAQVRRFLDATLSPQG